MEIFILTPRPNLPEFSNPWEPWYDKAFGFIVRAENAEEARKLANGKAGDENQNGTPWLDEKYSTCEPLSADGESGIIMKDFASA